MKGPFSVISAATLLASLLTQPVFGDDNAEAFSKLDINGDGFITEQEALAHAGLIEVFGDGDENSDGRLDMDEFSVLEITDE